MTPLDWGPAMPADYRIIVTPNGTRLKARIIPPDSFGLGTQLDRFFRERGTEPHRYLSRLMAIAKRGGGTDRPVNRDVRVDGNRQVGASPPVLAVVS